VLGKPVGYAAILTAALLFGMWATLGTILLRGVSPLAAAWVIQLVSTLSFAPFLGRLRLKRRDWKFGLVAAILGAVLAPSMYFTGLNLSTPVNAALLSNTEALFTGIFAYVFLKERLSRAGYVAAAAIIGGAMIVTLNLEQTGGDFWTALLGNVLLVLAAVCWGGSNTVSRVVTSHHDIPSYLCVSFGLGTLLLAPVVLLSGQPLTVPLESLPLIVFLGVTGSVVFTYLFYFAMRRIGALQVGAILATSAAFGVTIAVAFNYFPTPIQVVGGAVMTLGVVALYLQPPASGKEHVTEIAGDSGPPGPDGPAPKG